MRIALNAWFWNSPTTGSGQYTQRLVEHLIASSQNLEIILVTPEKVKDAGGKKQESSYSASCTLHPIPCPRTNLGKLWFEQVLFPRTCRRLGADVAHVPYWAPPLRSTVPTVVTIHDLIPLLLPEYRGGPLVRLYTALVSRTARHAALVLTDSQASRRDIIAHLRLPEERVRTVYLAAGEHYAPTPTPDDAQVRARYGLPQRYVLYLDGFDVRKNVTAVFGAYRRAQAAIGETCPLAIAGRLPREDTPFFPDPRRLAREQGVDEHMVHFTGYVEEADKPAVYRGAVAFLFPSHYEGFGLPPLEALACGTPVIGSDASSIPEIVGDAGVLLPPSDTEGMAKALIQLTTNESYRAELSRRAPIQATRFSWERAARETLATYRAAAGAIRS